MSLLLSADLFPCWASGHCRAWSFAATSPLLKHVIPWLGGMKLLDLAQDSLAIHQIMECIGNLLYLSGFFTAEPSPTIQWHPFIQAAANFVPVFGSWNEATVPYAPEPTSQQLSSQHPVMVPTAMPGSQNAFLMSSRWAGTLNFTWRAKANWAMVSSKKRCASCFLSANPCLLIHPFFIILTRHPSLFGLPIDEYFLPSSRGHHGRTQRRLRELRIHSWAAKSHSLGPDVIFLMHLYISFNICQCPPTSADGTAKPGSVLDAQRRWEEHARARVMLKNTSKKIALGLICKDTCSEFWNLVYKAFKSAANLSFKRRPFSLKTPLAALRHLSTALAPRLDRLPLAVSRLQLTVLVRQAFNNSINRTIEVLFQTTGHPLPFEKHLEYLHPRNDFKEMLWVANGCNFFIASWSHASASLSRRPSTRICSAASFLPAGKNASDGILDDSWCFLQLIQMRTNQRTGPKLKWLKTAETSTKSPGTDSQ